MSQYYSEALVRFVGCVLDIIPISMFETLNSIINIQTNLLKACGLAFSVIPFGHTAQTGGPVRWCSSSSGSCRRSVHSWISSGET